MSLFLMAVLMIFLLVLIWLIYVLVWGTPPWINLAVERWALKKYLSDPEGLTTMGLLDNNLLDFHSDKLTDVSPRYMARLRQFDRDGYLMLRRYTHKKLTGQKRITTALMLWYCTHNLSGH